MKVAVVGGGVAGIVASYLLSKQNHEVTLFEANSKIGGHTNTITTPSGVKVDTGFIVLNDRNYPLFSNFLKELGVETRYSDMSFSCSSNDFEWGTRDLNATFATRSNILNPRFYRFLLGIKDFWSKALNSLSDFSTLTEWCSKNMISNDVRENFLIPFAGAIWSAPRETVEELPVSSVFRFFKNHGMLSYSDQPKWQTILGGSERYVEKFCSTFTGNIATNSPVKKIKRTNNSISILTNDNQFAFDRAVIACHSNLVLDLLENPTDKEISLFNPWRYQLNKTYLHKDETLMPKRKAAWSSWNYVSRENFSFVTYDMKRLQGLNEQFFVTLNPPYSPANTLKKIDYYHPIYSKESVTTQKELPLIQGNMGTFYCGSYFGDGFHEDAVESAYIMSKVFS